MQTYRTNEAAIQDKADLGLLLVTLNASPATLRRNEDGLWVLRGARGYCSTWGDQKSWQLVVNEMSSALAWAWAKKRLAFCELVLDGDTEGVFRLRRLPSIEQAAEIRDILGFRKRVEWTPEELARRQEVGRRLAGG